MELQDTVLSIEKVEDDEVEDTYIYRISRKDGIRGRRIVYVLLKPCGLVPSHCRASGPAIIQHLSKLEEWHKTWQTLTLFEDMILLDDFMPHRLSKEQVAKEYRLYDLCSLRDVEEVKHRTWRSQESGVQCYFKVARFAFEMEALERETRAYLRLASAGTNLAPKLLGYAYEETPDRIVGLVIESVQGRRPSPADLEVCTNALEQLHGLGIIHGDINNHNIILCGDSVKFIDFEDSYIRLTSSDRSWGWRTSLEMKILEDRLLSQSDVGRPWN